MKESMIFYYGIKEDNTSIVARYEYDNQKKSYSINQKKDEIDIYDPFKVELDKMIAFFIGNINLSTCDTIISNET